MLITFTWSKLGFLNNFVKFWLDRYFLKNGFVCISLSFTLENVLVLYEDNGSWKHRQKDCPNFFAMVTFFPFPRIELMRIVQGTEAIFPLLFLLFSVYSLSLDIVIDFLLFNEHFFRCKLWPFIGHNIKRKLFSPHFFVALFIKKLSPHSNCIF